MVFSPYHVLVAGKGRGSRNFAMVAGEIMEKLGARKEVLNPPCTP